MCGHGNLACSMKQSVEMIYGTCDGIKTISFEPTENRETLVHKFNQLINPQKSTLIIVDLFGGSPFNAAAEIAFTAENIEVIAGMSLPLCLELVDNLDQLELNELVEHLVTAGNRCVVPLVKKLNDDMEDFV